jgi:hypothetical protein
MDIRIIKETPIEKEERHIIKCVHCKGSGICQNSVKKILEKSFSSLEWMECDLCGKRVIISKKSIKTLFSYPPSPTCKVCNGTGHVAL